MHGQRLMGWMVAGALAAVSGAGAHGQPTFRFDDPRDPGPVLTNDPFEYREFTVTIDILVLGADDFDVKQDINLERFSIMLPRPENTSAHQTYPDTLTGELRLDNKLIDNEPRLVDGYQGGVSLAVWEVVGSKKRRIVGENIHLRVQQEVVSFETNIDEARAKTYPWPAEGFEMPPEVASFLEPQLFVESDDPRFAALVNRWTNGKPRSVPPYVLAKFLMAQVMELYTPTGATIEGVTRGVGPFVTNVFIGGLRARGAVGALEEGKGSPLDQANLLCAVYRAAGLPARVVIGKDMQESKKREFPQYTAYVEFWIYDPQFERGEWIPADIVAQKQWASVPPQLELPWEFFGKNDRLDRVVPLGFHWVPPAEVPNAGSASLWGWIPEDSNGRISLPAADQVFEVTTFGRPLDEKKLKADQEIFLTRTGKPRNGAPVKPGTVLRKKGSSGGEK